MKKVLQKTVWIGLAYYVLVLVNACCHCEEQVSILYKMEGIKVRNARYVFEADTNFSAVTFTGDSIEAGAYGIQANIDAKRLATAKPVIVFGPSAAFACKCRPTVNELANKVVSVSIRTLKDFDATHLAGANVDEYFKFVQVEYVKDKGRVVKNPLYKTPHIAPEQNYSFYLDALPASGQQLQFEISFKDSNGLLFKDTTSVITIR